ncbi:MAG TPA: DUF998 domain-containing protein [Clostridia bacterium]
MKFINYILKYAGVAAIPVYIIFTYASHIHNRKINPLEFWLSEYGNPIFNPSGAVIYNTGCVLTAILLAIFYIGMYRWYRRGRTARRFNIAYMAAQASGLIGSVFVILTTIYTLGTDNQMHSIFSTANMIAMDFFLSFTATGFLMNPKIHKSVGIFGFFASAFNVVTMNAFSDFYISEWIFFLLFMIYMILVAVQYEKLAVQKTDVS